MEVYVVLTIDHDDLVGVAKNRFGVVKLIADYLRCTSGQITLGRRTAKAVTHDGSITHRFMMYKEEVIE